MTTYTDPRGRRVSAEDIARAWIRANRAKAQAMLEASAPRASPFPAGFGVEVEEGEGGEVTVRAVD